MFDEKISIPIAIILPAAIFSYSSFSSIPKYLFFFSIIILLSVFAKKAVGYYLEVEAKTEIWDFKQYWFAERHHLPKPVPLGIIVPILLYIFSYGTFKWLALTQTEFKAKITKKIRKRKSWSHIDLRELDVALICFMGIISTLALAIVSFPFSTELSMISLLYAFFNILPLGKIDGVKLFFSNKSLYLVALLALAGTAIILGILQIPSV